MLIVSMIPSISTVYAPEQVSQIEANMELQPDAIPNNGGINF